MGNDYPQIVIDLHRLCDEISGFEASGDADIEAQYERLLFFLSTHVAERAAILQALIHNVREYRNARKGGGAFVSIDALAYCMHVLRWPEIYDAAVDEHVHYFSPRRDQMLLRIIDSFDEDWPDAICYRRFGGDAATRA
jgi:hypothetical protein